MVKYFLPIAFIILLVILGFFLLRRPVVAPPILSETRQSPPAGPAERTKTRYGIVIGYHYNAHLDVNAIQLKTAKEGIITVEFHPHTAKLVMTHAAVGDSVAIMTSTHPTDEYIVYQLHRIENLTTHQQADLDELPPPPDIPPDKVTENFTIAHPPIITDPYGGIDGIQHGNILFHFKPGLVDDIADLIKSADTIRLSAVRRSDEFGFINIHHDKVYIVLSLTIDNKTFLVR